MSINPSIIALVTGANRGIGLEIARQLAHHGIRVLLPGRRKDAVDAAALELRNAGLDVEALVLDVTQSASISAAADEVARKYGRLDILVNNAAIRIEEYGKQPSEQPLHKWRETFDTNLFGMVEVTLAFLPLIRRSAAGRIVNVSSLLASLGMLSLPFSEGSAMRLVQALAKRLNPYERLEDTGRELRLSSSQG